MSIATPEGRDPHWTDYHIIRTVVGYVAYDEAGLEYGAYPNYDAARDALVVYNATVMNGNTMDAKVVEPRIMVGNVELTKGQEILQARIHSITREFMSKRQQGHFMERVRNVVEEYRVPVIPKVGEPT